MPSQELIEELDAIQAIYPESLKELTPDIYNITIPEHDDVIVQMSFPHNYPNESPNIIQVVTKDAIKFPDNSYVEEKMKEILESTFHSEEVVIFEFIGEVTLFLENFEEEHREQIEQARAKAQQKQVEREVARQQASRETTPYTIENKTLQDVDVLKGWIQSDPIHDRGSTFVAFAKSVNTVEEAEEALELLVTDRKVARSNHNMNAWRIKGENGVSFQDCDDDGETAAGLRMLHLMTVCIYLFCHAYLQLAGQWCRYLSFLILTLDHGRVECDCCRKQMVWRNPHWARQIQTHQLGHKGGSYQGRL